MFPSHSSASLTTRHPILKSAIPPKLVRSLSLSQIFISSNSLVLLIYLEIQTIAMNSATQTIASFIVLPKSPPTFRKPTREILSGFPFNGRETFGKLYAVSSNGSVYPSLSQGVRPPPSSYFYFVVNILNMIYVCVLFFLGICPDENLVRFK